MSESTNPFAVIVPTEADLSAPIAAATELSKLFIIAAKKTEALATCTRDITATNAEGQQVRTIIDHPDLKWWFDRTAKLAVEVAKLTFNAQTRAVDQKLKTVDMFLQSDILTKEQQEALIIMTAKERKIHEC